MKIGLLARIEAKPEHADEVAAMLIGAVELALEERNTVTWFAFRESDTVFGVFDTFNDQSGRQAHMAGQIAAALMGATATKLAAPPDIRPVDLLSFKIPQS